jgi:hypothetical protein
LGKRGVTLGEYERSHPELAEQLSARFRANLVAWLRSGEPAADWALFVMRDVSDEGHLAACHRILGRLRGLPIHPKRWTRYGRRLMAAAEDHEHAVADRRRPPRVTLQENARHNSWEAVRAVVERVQLDDWDIPEVRAGHTDLLRKFRNELTSLIMADLLGPSWRRHDAREAIEYAEERSVPVTPQERADACAIRRAEEAAVAPDELAELEVALRALARLGGLTAQQSETCATYLDTGLDRAEAADRLGIRINALDQRLHAIRLKLRGAWADLAG